MLKHIQIPASTTAVGTPSTATTFAQTPSTRSRPPPPLINLNRSQQPLNVSTLTTASNITSNGGPSLLQTYSNTHQTPLLTHSYPETHTKPLQNGHVPRMFTPLPTFSSNSQQHLLKSYGSNNSNNNNNHINNTSNSSTSTSSSKIIKPDSNGAREALTSLGLLCLVSLLLALLSLIFLLKISPGTKQFHNVQQNMLGTTVEEYAIVFDVTLALCALSLSLNLCCLLVCAIQFLFAVKLVGATPAVGRENKYLQKSSVSRVCAIGGFFISIPIFLTGIILYTFTQFHSTPAIVTSILIGIGILFCGGAMVHNVFIWQKEKTTVFNCIKQQQHQMLQMQQHQSAQHNNSMHHAAQPSLIARQTPLNLSMNSPISTIHNPMTNNSTRDITLDQINNHSYVNGGGLAHINTTLNNTHLSLLSQAAVTPNSYFGLRTTPPTPKSQQLHNGSPNTSTTLDQSSNFRNTSVTTAHELSTLV